MGSDRVPDACPMMVPLQLQHTEPDTEKKLRQRVYSVSKRTGSAVAEPLALCGTPNP